MVDIEQLEAELARIKRPKGRPKDYGLNNRRLSVAMEYYRFLYLEGEPKQRAINKTARVLKISVTSVKTAIKYYSDETGEGHLRLMKTIAYGLYNQYKVIGDIKEQYRLKGYGGPGGKPFPYWLSQWCNPSP